MESVSMRIDLSNYASLRVIHIDLVVKTVAECSKCKNANNIIAASLGSPHANGYYPQQFSPVLSILLPGTFISLAYLGQNTDAPQGSSTGSRP